MAVGKIRGEARIEAQLPFLVGELLLLLLLGRELRLPVLRLALRGWHVGLAVRPIHRRCLLLCRCLTRRHRCRKLCVLLLLLLFSRKLVLEVGDVVGGVVLHERLRWRSLGRGAVRRLLLGAKEARRDEQKNGTQIDEHLDVLAYHALRLGGILRELRCLIRHDITPSVRSPCASCRSRCIPCPRSSG